MAKQLVEVKRTFLRKVNTGNFENMDIGCEVKAEVDYDDMEETSSALYDFCLKEVEKDIELYKQKPFEHDGSPQLKAKLMANGEKKVWDQEEYNRNAEIERLRREGQKELV